ncbi:hypothetical protein IFR05_000354 [Cadophora sp. M221]|nr:hypothetical protein IFR05_000354 [Cadophora sp. M221]
MKTVNTDAPELRLNSPRSSVNNASPVTGAKTNNSSIDLILQEVESILNHKSPWFSFEPRRHTLSESEYRELLERVQGESPELQKFWHNKLRQEQYRRTAEIRQVSIKSIGGGSTLPFEGPYAERQPDVGFLHLNPPPQTKSNPEYQYPAFIIEVAYSQTSEDLENVAYDYINGSKGKIKTVVGIDIGYEKQNAPKNEDSSRLATISIWKAKTKGRNMEVQKVLDAKPFRHANGFLVAGEQALDAEVAWRESIKLSDSLRNDPTKPITALLKMSRYEDTDNSSDEIDPRMDKSNHGKKRYHHGKQE